MPVRVVVRGEIVQRVPNLLPRVALHKLRVRLAPKLQPPVVVWPVAFADSRQSPLLALPAVSVPFAVRVLIETWTVFAHE